MKLFYLVLMLFSFSLFAKDKSQALVNGQPIRCDREVYNCPSYKGKYQEKRLKTCEDLKKVWSACKSDVHDLDRDKDGKPCEKDCAF